MIRSASALTRRFNSAPLTGSPSIAIAPFVSSIDPLLDLPPERLTIDGALCRRNDGATAERDEHRQQNRVDSTHDHSSSGPSSRCSQYSATAPSTTRLHRAADAAGVASRFAAFRQIIASIVQTLTPMLTDVASHTQPAASR